MGECTLTYTPNVNPWFLGEIFYMYTYSICILTLSPHASHCPGLLPTKRRCGAFLVSLTNAADLSDYSAH